MSTTEFDEPLYADHEKVYPQMVKGKFRRIKWGVMFVTLGIYYFLPFLRWDRGPNAPDQAVLVDFAGRRFYFFAIEIWPQEVYYITGLLILASFGLFLANAIAGRLWCGYTCPQTVWTDLFIAVENWIEGDRRSRIQLDEGSWTAAKLGKKAAKHFTWLMIAWWTGGAWVLYFSDAPTLVVDLLTFQAPWPAYMWIGILTGTTYLLAGFAREQVCTYMCPWPRIQAALTDEHALNVTYRYDRGEPRMSVKKARAAEKEGAAAGACIECYQCVHACPTGIDIRDGLQLECIQCGLCIDACDRVMEKVGRPTGLIGYDTDINIKRRQGGLPNMFNRIRPRTLTYTGLIALVGLLMLVTLVNRPFIDVTVQHDRNPQYVQLAEGGERSGARVNITNKRLYRRRFLVHVRVLDGAIVEVVGGSADIAGTPAVEVGPDTTQDFRILVSSPPDLAPESTSMPITFRIMEMQTGETATAKDFFKSPER